MPFRELFIEVPQALLEAAVIEAQQRAKPKPPSWPATTTRWRLDSDQAARALMIAYGWSGIEWQHQPLDCATDLIAHLPCGHVVRYKISDQALAAARPYEVRDVIDRAVQAKARRCFCVLPTTQTTSASI